MVMLTNDDGILSPGIQILREGVGKYWEIVLVAPDREQSAASHALTLQRPLRIHRLDSSTMAVDGTPTDCVMLALKGVLDTIPDLVVSGINSGANLGDDVIYSGTVAAAAEAVVLGVPSVAVSMVEPEKTDLSYCADIVVTLIRTIFRNRLPKGIYLNVNIPREWTGGRFEITHLGQRSYRDVIVEKMDPRGKPYYWIGGQVEEWRGDDRCDFAAIERGNISVTPLQLDMTATEALPDLQSWSFE